jgi:hypothetical protein
MAHVFMAEGDRFYIASMRKLLRITAVCTTQAEANARMARTDDAVIAVVGELIFLADRHDRGLPIEQLGKE